MSSSSSSSVDVHVRDYTKQYINGAWVTSTNGEHALLDVVDSNTGEVFARAPRGSSEDTKRAVDAAHGAFDG